MLLSLMDFLCSLAGMIPLECMQMRFIQEALIAILLLSPLAAAAGIQVVNFRMSFFSDAIGHSVFAGIAAGLIFSISPGISMSVLALIVGFGIIALKRNSRLSSDTVIGVFYSAVAAAGLMLVSRNPNLARDMQTFLYGDILTVSHGELLYLAVLFFLFILFQIIAFNRLIVIGLNQQLARAHRIHSAFFQYLYVGLLALIVIVAVRAAGVLLVTAMLIVPPAAARNFSKSSAEMFWISLIIGLVSGISGLLLSAQNWLNAASGATIVICACFLFVVSLFCKRRA